MKIHTLALFLVITFVSPFALSMKCIKVIKKTDHRAEELPLQIKNLLGEAQSQSLQYEEKRLNTLLSELTSLSKNPEFTFSETHLALIETKIKHKLHILSKYQLTNWFKFFSLKNYRLSNEWYSFLNLDFIANNEKYSIKDILVLLRSIHDPSSLSTDFHEALISYFTKRRTFFDPREIKRFITSYTFIYETSSSPKIINSVEVAFISKHNQFNLSQISHLIYSLSKARIMPGRKFKKIFFNELSYLLGKNGVEYEKYLGMVLSGVSHLKLELPQKIKDQLLYEIKSNLLSFSTNSIATFIHSFYLLGEFQAVKSIVTDHKFFIEPSTLEPKFFTIFYTVKLYFEKVLDTDLPTINIEYDLQRTAIIKPTNESNLERIAEEAIKSKGILYEKEYRASSGFYIDFYFYEKNLLVQIDGPSHFIRLQNGKLEYRYEDIRFDELHKALGYSTFRISYERIDSL